MALKQLSSLSYEIVLGVASDPIREKLLYESGLCLASACAIVRACESIQSARFYRHLRLYMPLKTNRVKNVTNIDNTK